MLNPRPMAKDELSDFLAQGEPTTAEFFKANISDGFDNSSLGVAYDSVKEIISAAPEKRASEKQAQENITAFYDKRKPEIVDRDSPQPTNFGLEDYKKSTYFRDGVEFQDGWSQERAKYLAESFDERKERELTIAKGNPDGFFSVKGAIGLTGQMVGGLPDPINLIPFGGAATKTAKVGEKLIRAGIEGAVGNLAVSAVARPYWEKRGVDSDWKDYVNDVWIGGLMGGGFGLAGHGFSKGIDSAKNLPVFNELKFNKADVNLKDQAKLAEAGDHAIDAVATGKEVDLSKIEGLQKTYDSIYEIPEVQRSRKVQDMTEELASIGYSVDEARTSIAPIVAQAEAFSRDFGISVDDFLDQYGPSFQKSELIGNGKAERIVKKPTTEIEIELSKIVDAEISNMRAEIMDAEAGTRIFEDGSFKGSQASTFPQWFKDMGFTSKEEALKAIDNKTTSYDKIKTYAQEKLAATDPEYQSISGDNLPDVPNGPDGQPLFKKSDGKARGAITFKDDGKAVIHLFEHADQSTIIHETGHLFLNNLERFSKMENAPERIKADFDSIKSWMGVESGKKIETKHHEKFARGFEQFLREGKAPRPELQGVFNRFKDWLTSIYKSSDQLKAKLSDDARAVYSRLLGAETRPKVEPMAEVRAPEPRFKSDAEVEVKLNELEAMAQTNPELVNPVELETYKNSMSEIDSEALAMDEVSTFFQGARTDKELLEAANKAGISKTQFEKIIDEFDNKLKNEDDARLGIEKLIEQRRIELAAEAKELKRQAYLSLSARTEVSSHIDKVIQGGGTATESVLSLLEGVSNLRGVEGAGKSVDGSYMALAQSTSSRAFSELRKVDPSIEKLFERDVQFNQNVAKEMMSPGSSGDAIAKQSGEILSRYSNELRERANLAGANIGKLEGHVPRSHDVEKMVGKEVAWVDFMMENLDPERSFKGMDEASKRAALAETFRSLVTGEHQNGIEVDVTQPLMRPPRNIAKKMGESRSLHFKGPEVEVAYLKEFGQGENILESMSKHYEGMSRKIALMERLGPNPESTISFMVDKLRNDIRDKKIFADLDDAKTVKMLNDLGNSGSLKSRDSEVGHAMMQALGETSSDHGLFRRTSQVIRAVNSLSKLGSALLSQPTDFVHSVNERRLFSNRNEAALWVETFQDYFSSPSKEKLEIMDHLGIFVDGINYKNFNKFDGDNLNNKLGRANDFMFRWSGQNWHVKHSKQAAGLSLAKELGSNISKSWNDVHPGLKEMLVQYGSITEKKWDMLRKAEALKVDGKDYFHPGLIEKIPDSAFEADLPPEFQASKQTDLIPGEAKTKEFETGRANAIKRERFKLEMDLKTFFVEESRNAAPEPDAKVRRVMNFGTKGGTKTNEAIKLLTQFKTFAFVNYDRSLKGKRMMRDSKDYGGIAHHAVATLALGYISTLLKDLAKGQTPADPTMPGTWGRAAMQSGGLGIAGDFFGSAYSARSGSDVLSSMAGPTVSTISNLSVLALKGVHGETYEDGSKYASKWIDAARSVAPAPFSSLWYTRAAMDHLVWQKLKETLEPGSIRRSQKRLKKQYNQKYIVSPN